MRNKPLLVFLPVMGILAGVFGGVQAADSVASGQIPSSLGSEVAVDNPEAGLIGRARFESVAQPRSVSLIQIDQPVRVRQTDPALRAASDEPEQVGEGITVTEPEIDPSRINWQKSFAGGLVGRFEIAAKDAGGLRAALRIASANPMEPLTDALLAKTLFHFGGAGDQVFETTAKAIIESENFWTPLADGDTIKVEIVLPPGAHVGAMRIDIPVLSYMPKETRQSLYSDSFGRSGKCQKDIICASHDVALQKAATAVAKMIYTESWGASYLCTGTLVNNSSRPKRHLFLTANHCIKHSAAAASLQTTWFYKTTQCGGAAATVNPAVVTLFGGAKLLYPHAVIDMSLLELNNRPPAGANYQGWNTDPIRRGDFVTAIHHPKGDAKKHSYGRVDRRSEVLDYAGIVVRWLPDLGVTEGGSSGSPIFTKGSSGLELRGTLMGGGSSCGNALSSDHYGDFSHFYRSAHRYFSPPA